MFDYNHDYIFNVPLLLLASDHVFAHSDMVLSISIKYE